MGHAGKSGQHDPDSGTCSLSLMVCNYLVTLTGFVSPDVLFKDMDYMDDKNNCIPCQFEQEQYFF